MPKSIEVPDELFAQIEKIASRQKRSVEEVVCEALHRCERSDWWDDVNEFGRKMAAAAGVFTEEDVVKAVYEVRKLKQ